MSYFRKIIILFFVFLVKTFLGQVNKVSSPGASDNQQYLPNTVIVKLSEVSAHFATGQSINNPAFQNLYLDIAGKQLRRKFPFAKAPETRKNKLGQTYADLTLIYEFSYDNSLSVEMAIKKLMNLNIFEYAEPHILPELLYTPNDPAIPIQYAMDKIQAEAAWGINTTTARGDTNIVIAITDTGIELTHSDLSGNIKKNYADPIDGSDNDADGYTDNFNGWDLGDNDNDPTYYSTHGVHVSGIASASTDNGIGVAGVGFRCKFLPVKIENSFAMLVGAYEGIVYAADHNAQIINCSWGSLSGGQLGQDVVTYASINKNSLVICGAGNNGLNTNFYPASYKYAVSVASTDINDEVASNSNYGFSIDVCAPGENIFNTVPVDTYVITSGTSMASPCVAGAAGIVKSFFPSYNALQVAEQLKISCDNIYGLNSVLYLNRLGHGRINLYNALTSVSPSVLTDDYTITDNNDNILIPGDTVRFRGNFINYLAPASNVTAVFNTGSPHISMIDGSTTLGAMSTLGLADNNADPFSFLILPSAPLNANIVFTLTISDASTSYSHTEFFTIPVNVDYVNIDINDVSSTITSIGRIGYKSEGQVGGLGFSYMNGSSLLYEAGLMVGNSSSVVSDVVRGSGATADLDFQSLVRAHVLLPPVFSEFDVQGSFNDFLATTPLPLTINHYAHAWSSAGNRKFIIVRYTLINFSGTALSNVFAGIFADWDVDAASFSSNRASYDLPQKLGYVYRTTSPPLYTGIKLLTTSAPALHYAIDNIAGGGGGVNIADGYDTSEKFITLSTSRNEAGLGGSGNDVAQVVSTGPLYIPANDSVMIAFALLAGDSLPDLLNSAVNAQTMYHNMGLLNSVHDFEADEKIIVYPNPASTSATILLELTQGGRISIDLFNVLGEKVLNSFEGFLGKGIQQSEIDLSGLDNGIYQIVLISGAKKITHKLVVCR